MPPPEEADDDTRVIELHATGPSWATASARARAAADGRRGLMLVLAMDTATPRVSVALGRDGARARRPEPRRRAPARRAARARDPVPVRRGRRRSAPARVRRGRSRPGPVHRAARRRDDGADHGADAAHPDGRRPDPRPDRLPAAAHEPDRRLGGRRPAQRGVLRLLPTGPRRRAAVHGLRGRHRPTRSPASSRRAARMRCSRATARCGTRRELGKLDRVELAGPGAAPPSAAALVELATARYEREEFSPPAEVHPLYLRRSDAEIEWDRKGRVGGDGATTRAARRAHRARCGAGTCARC